MTEHEKEKLFLFLKVAAEDRQSIKRELREVVVETHNTQHSNIIDYHKNQYQDTIVIVIIHAVEIILLGLILWKVW